MGSGRTWALASVLALASTLLGGCAGLAVDTRHSALSQGPRVDLLVIHYTALDFEESLRVLTQQEVSSHYLVDVDPPTIYRLVPETQRANHAGVSTWAGRRMLNLSSIGIEIVNPGRRRTPTGEHYVPYPNAQIEAVVALVRDITQRWGIPKERVVGHADVAPGRKQDPGPLFPWKRLADAGLALWFDEARAAALRPQYEAALPPPGWFRLRLAQLGYGLERPEAVAPARPADAAAPDATPDAPAGTTAGTSPNTTADTTADIALRDALVSFQMRFRPARYDGSPDAQTAAILAALTQP